MPTKPRTLGLIVTLLLAVATLTHAQKRDESIAGDAGGDPLVIADAKAAKAKVVVAAAAGTWEKRAAEDLVKYVELMTGAKLEVVNDAAAAKGNEPVIVLGSIALDAEPSLKASLDKAAKKNPELRADAIALKRVGNRLYAAGNHDEAHYYAVAELLKRWGCRWYMPSEFGECIPEHARLTVGKLDYAYGTPFEVRGYWISWNGEQTHAPEFRRRNFMCDIAVGGGHALAQFTKDVTPPGKTHMNIPIAEDKTADAIASHPEVLKNWNENKDFTLGMEDGVYTSDSKLDAELRAGLYDKYFLTTNLTDNFLLLYNKVCERLLKANPNSKARIGFLAYSNITIPPQREIIAAKPLVASLAPIDIDPNHAMDDRRSPPKIEYREMMYRWSQVMQGRVFIYDYDQGMLVWRDLPNPVIQAFRRDVKFYEDAKILGVSTESRNAIATVWLNLYLRGQLLWNPSADVDAMLAEFYPKFYGPAAEPMAKYWGLIYKAWEDTIITEHEHFTAAAIYTKELVEALRPHVAAAEAALQAAQGRLGESRDWAKYQDRVKLTRLSFNLIDQYTGAWRAAATEADYKKAAELGDKALATRLEIAGMNTTFTTRIHPKTSPVPETKETGPAWMMGEIEQYRKLAEFTDGAKGTLVTKLPIEWAYHRDPHDTGVAQGYAYNPVDMRFWESHGKGMKLEDRKDYPTTEWEMLRTDLYAQAQGILHPDWQSFTGWHWYRTEVELKPDQTTGAVHVKFPGVFNTSWLYVNGYLVNHRPQGDMWWLNDYAFEWDVDLAGKLKPGKNTITVRLQNPHHFGGIFRRPFLYRAK